MFVGVVRDLSLEVIKVEGGLGEEVKRVHFLLNGFLVFLFLVFILLFLLLLFLLLLLLFFRGLGFLLSLLGFLDLWLLGFLCLGFLGSLLGDLGGLLGEGTWGNFLLSVPGLSKDTLEMSSGRNLLIPLNNIGKLTSALLVKQESEQPMVV